MTSQFFVKISRGVRGVSFPGCTIPLGCSSSSSTGAGIRVFDTGDISPVVAVLNRLLRSLIQRSSSNGISGSVS